MLTARTSAQLHSRCRTSLILVTEANPSLLRLRCISTTRDGCALRKLCRQRVLKVGANDLVISNGAGTGASAIRATQVQLKYIWDKSDYLLRTGN